jgi:DNA end-binding protein Ku
MLLHYPCEVRQASEYFDEIQDGKITKEMRDLVEAHRRTKIRTF